MTETMNKTAEYEFRLGTWIEFKVKILVKNLLLRKVLKIKIGGYETDWLTDSEIINWLNLEKPFPQDLTNVLKAKIKEITDYDVDNGENNNTGD